MSYCVNCGVELDQSAKKCALCSTLVINPNLPEPESAKAPFSETPHIPQKIKTKFIALLVSMIILVPNIVCLLLNIFIFPNAFWSLYISATSFLTWVIFVSPFFTEKKGRPYLMWCFDTISVALYVWFFFAVGHEDINWYLKGVLPIILVISALVLIFMIWVRSKKRHWVLKTLHIFTDIGVAALISGTILTTVLKLPFAFEIGITVFVCVLSIVAFLAYCYSSKTIRKWLSKRFFT